MLEFGPETVLIIVGFGLSIFTIISAVLHSSWGPRRHGTTEALHAAAPIADGIDFHVESTPEAEARRDDTIRSFLAALETERSANSRRQ